MEDEEELENGDDDEIQARKKLLKLLEQGDNDDDEDGVAIEYNSGDEGVAPSGGKENKLATANGNAANENGDLEDDDDIMGDEY